MPCVEFQNSDLFVHYFCPPPVMLTRGARYPLDRLSLWECDPGQFENSSMQGSSDVASSAHPRGACPEATMANAGDGTALLAAAVPAAIQARAPRRTLAATAAAVACVLARGRGGQNETGKNRPRRSTLFMFPFNPGVQIVNGRISGGVSQWTFRCTT
jgi:hypothetical protein